MSVVLDGQPLCFTSAGTTLTASGAAALRLVAYGSRNPTPLVADSGDGFDVELVLDRAALLAAGATTATIAGDTRFEPSTDAVSIASAVHTARAAQSALIQHVAVRRSCFCSQYTPAAQVLHGELRLDEVSTQRLRGALRVDVEGQVPFWNGGGGLRTPEVAVELEARFDLTLPP